MAFIPGVFAAIGSIGTTIGAMATTGAANVLGAVGAEGAASAVAANGLIPSLGGAGAVLSATGTAASAIAAQRAASFNAKVQEAQGRLAAEQGAAAAGEAARDDRQRQAAARAGSIQNGLELTGSVSDLLSQASRQGNLDYLTAAYDGTLGNISGQNNARLTRMEGRGALIGGLTGAGSRLLGGIADVYRNRTAQLAV